jgi:hypothetical protein
MTPSERGIACPLACLFAISQIVVYRRQNDENLRNGEAQPATPDLWPRRVG